MTTLAQTSPVKARLLGLAVAGAVFALDQIVKWAMIGPLDLPRVEQITLLPIFNFTWAENYGVSLGLLTAGSDLERWLLVGMTGAIALGVAVWIFIERRMGEILPLGLVLGGALGNILDRVAKGFVVDYADHHIGSYRPFYIFNLADVAITFGVLIILARSFLSGKKRGHIKLDAAPSTPEN